MTSDRSPGEWSLAVRQQAAVAHLGQFGLRTSDIDEVFQEALVVLADTLGVTEAALFELQGDELVGKAGLRDGRSVSRRRMAKVRGRRSLGSLPAYALDHDVTAASSDLLHDPRLDPQVHRFGVPVRSGVAAPIAWEDGEYGVLAAYDLSLRAWSDDEQRFVQSIANTVGLAVQRAQVEQSLRESTARLDLSLEAGGLGAWSWDPDTGAVHLNAAAREMFGVAPSVVLDGAAGPLALVHPDDREGLREAVASSVESGDEEHNVVRIIRPDNGELRWVESWGRAVDGERGRQVVGVCSDVTERRRADEVRDALLAREQAARIEAERARERLAFLSEASRILATSLEPEVTVVTLADLCVPDLADAVFLELVDEDGLLAHQVARAVTETMLHDGLALRRRRAELGADAPTRSGHEIAVTGTVVVYGPITDEQLELAAVDADHLNLLKRYDARSTILVPLVTRGRTIGVVTLVRTSQSKPYDDDDVALAEELASRAAMAVDNGRLFHSRNRVARSLQSALLPPSLPAAPGLELAARYDVAEADVAIGGDFYDVIAIAPDRWGIVVGDVCGRGPDAAALTGLVRHTLRTAVVREQVPSKVLAHTNTAVLAQIDDAKFCTAAYLRIAVGDPGPGRARVVASSAGHPRPVLLRADGSAEVVECTGTLLGVVDQVALTDVELELGPGDAVVLYTDGVTEARRGHEQFGEERLLATLSSLAGRTADEIAGALESEVVSFRRNARDDTAILVIRSVPPA